MDIQHTYDDENYRDRENLKTQLGEGWQKRIFEVVVTNVALSVYSDGLAPAQARQMDRVMRALDLSQSRTILLDQADAEFLKGLFFNEKARVGPLQSNIFCLIQDAIEVAFRK